MRKLMVGTFQVAFFVVFVSLLASGSALALPFDVAGGSASGDDPYSNVEITNQEGWGWSSVSAELDGDLDDQKFILDEGESKTIDFFTLDFKGTGLGIFNLAATLAFESPLMSSSSTGSAWYFTTNFCGSFTGGQLTWEQNTPKYFIIDDQYITVQFENLLGITAGQTVTVHATITNHGSLPVPEPATMILLGTGLLGIAAFSRRKILKKES